MQGGELNVDGHVVGGPFDTVHLVCAGCGVKVWPRVGAYWFVLLEQRGRVRFPGATDARLVVCSGCGRRVREALESAGIGESAYRTSGTTSKRFMTGP
jgi:hypothetical protein